MTKTVAILGAGASWDFGLPTGEELVAHIENLCRTAGAERTSSRDASLFLAAALADTGAVRHQVLEQCSRKADLLRRQMPQSIDWFLGQDFGPELHMVKRLGLIAIAQIIGRYERTNASWPLEPQMRLTGGDAISGRNWLKTFWQSLGVRNLEDFQWMISEQRLRIVTFNYDRCVDQFIANRLAALREAQSKPKEGSLPDADLLGELDICHVYGDLGKIGCLPYGSLHQQLEREEQRSTVLPGRLKVCASRLTVIEAERSGESLGSNFAKAQGWIAAADRLVFLGFGFDPANVSRLGFPNLAKRCSEVFATSYALGAAARDEVCQVLMNNWEPSLASNVLHEHQSWSVDTYLRHFQPFRDLGRMGAHKVK
jgi:hypothetical protein